MLEKKGKNNRISLFESNLMWKLLSIDDFYQTQRNFIKIGIIKSFEELSHSY